MADHRVIEKAWKSTITYHCPECDVSHARRSDVIEHYEFAHKGIRPDVVAEEKTHAAGTATSATASESDAPGEAMEKASDESQDARKGYMRW